MFCRLLLLLLCPALFVHSLQAQNPCDQSVSEQLSGVVVGVNRTVALPIAFTLNKKVYGATVNVNADLGQDYIFGRSWDYPFSAVINFQLQALDASNAVVPGVFNSGSYTITLDNDHPEASFVKDFSSLAGTNGTFAFSKFKVTLTSVSVTTSGSTPSSILTQISTNLRMFLGYDIKYGFSLSTATAPTAVTMGSQDIAGTREVSFSWNASNQEFCNYQFQLLRLYNNTLSTSTDERIITAAVDWSEALTIQTESAATKLKLTVAEGQGYYLWRVRPIGTYYPGGIANPLNLVDNLWSTAPSSGSSLSLTTGSFSSYPTLFFLSDPDDKLNRIYSRTFTEGNKVSETSTYANSLMQVKQTQSYLPSKDTTLVVQHVLDLSGRPALTTIPAPTDSSMYQGYKSNFFQTESAELYRDKNYDVDSNYNNPRRAKQTTGAYKYYSQNNSNDPNVADAQGYPYQRTQYYNDGTDRVKQQSGVGKQQMIGNGTSSDAKGEGKTVKTYYGTPTEQELIQLFGDEAPSSENVFKTINIDQNNTATITLTNKEGKVIATSLSFQDADNDGVFEPLDGEGVKTTLNTVSDTVTVNTRTPAGFVSSKRIAILQTTPVNIGYQISCDTLTLPCANGEIDCGYHLKIQYFNLDSNTVHVVYDNDLKTIACASVSGKSGTYKTLTLSPVTLAPGNYIIQKNLTTGNVSVAITAAQDKIDIQTGPITGLIKGWLADVKCPPQLNDFFTKIRTLATHINNGTAGFYGFPEEFMDIYNTNPSAFHLSITPATGNPQLAVLTTPCCGSLRVPINWVPPFNCPTIPRLVDKNGNGKLDVHDYNPYASPDSLDQPEEFFPDFEGYARVFLQECWDSTEFYGKYMEGWKPGQFNLMVYHMLTDQYNCTNNYPDEDTTYLKKKIDSLANETKTVYDACGDSVGTYTSSGLDYGCGPPITLSIYGVPTAVPACPQYTCDALFGCWSTQLAALRAKICLNIDYEQENNNVGDKSDKQQPGGFGSNFDNNVTSGGLLGKWIAKRAVSKRMKDLQAGGSGTVNATYERHLVQDFLECTGYRFAKILTQYDRNPLPSDDTSDVDYTVGPAGTNHLSDMDQSKKGNGDYFYMPFSDWTPGKTLFTSTPTPTEANSREYKGFFPLIKNPIYAFKYFEYPYESTADYQDVETMTCYSDPNECYLTFDPNGDTAPTRIPCCVTLNTDGSYDTTQCYRDYSYPNLDKLPLDGDASHPTYGILQDGLGVKYKLTVENFCSVGRYSCLYTKDVWSCGQRTAFYLALKSYQVPPADFGSIDLDRSCSFLNTLNNWYHNPESDANGFPDTLSYGEVTTLISTMPEYTFPDFTPLKFQNVSGDSVTQISMAEMEMVKMNTSCKDKCENRRDEIVQMLQDLLLSKCYVIGPCKTNSDYVADNVIPEDDFNAMVDGVIGQCKSQCAITTFRCAPTAFCRKFKTVKTFLGNNITDDNKITYGVGGAASDAPYCTLVPGLDYYDCSAGADTTLSYCEYTKYKEASGWFMELDIQSACDGKQYTRSFSCAEGNDTCVPKDSYEKVGTPDNLPAVTTQAVPVNVVVEE